jgi:hypothetical protein
MRVKSYSRENEQSSLIPRGMVKPHEKINMYEHIFKLVRTDSPKHLICEEWQEPVKKVRTPFTGVLT